MSDAEPVPGPSSLRGETVIAVVVGVLVVAALWFVLSQRQQVLRNSPAGFDGLQVWLASEGVSAQNFWGGWPIDQDSIGLLMLPVYDTALDQDRRFARTKEELLFQQDEYDLEIGPLLERAGRVPSLIVLPKWRSGMRLTGLGHPVLLVEKTRVDALLRGLTGDRGARLRYGQSAFTDYRYRTVGGEYLNAQIYAAQMFQGVICAPIIGRSGAMLLADCPLAGGDPESRVLILSDPDLLNNHGLRLGQNAEIARDFLHSRAGDRNLLIDYSRISWLRDPDASVSRERTWADFKRFFDPPFRLLWLGAAMAMAMFLWRSGLRYGPVRSARSAPEASKALAVRARARLMRLSNQDGALIAEYTSARISAASSMLLGPAHARHYANEDAFLRYVRRRHPGYATRLEQVLTTLRGLPTRISAAEAIRHVDDLERVLEHIANDT